MAFYDLDKDERTELVAGIEQSILKDIKAQKSSSVIRYFSDEDTYIRKSAYQAVGKIYKQHAALRKPIVNLLENLFKNENEKIRQTVVNSAGEIGMSDYKVIGHLHRV